MLPRCLQTGQQEQTSPALKMDKGEDWSLTDSSEDELKEAWAENLIERISLDPSSHSSSGTDLNPWGRVDIGLFVDRCIGNPCFMRSGICALEQQLENAIAEPDFRQYIPVFKQDIRWQGPAAHQLIYFSMNM